MELLLDSLSSKSPYAGANVEQEIGNSFQKRLSTILHQTRWFRSSFLVGNLVAH